jgi:hypothetical protein
VPVGAHRGRLTPCGLGLAYSAEVWNTIDPSAATSGSFMPTSAGSPAAAGAAASTTGSGGCCASAYDPSLGARISVGNPERDS